MIFILTFALFAGAMVLAYLLARALTGAARRLSLRWGVVSRVTERSSHAQPTPRLGGAGLALGFGLASAILLAGLWRIPHDRALLGFDPALVMWAALGWAMMFGAGLVDDLLDLPPLAKLGLMALAALAPTLGGGIVFHVTSFVHLSANAVSCLDLAVSVLWILFFANIYNFMDGMDGFAANFARVASGFMFLILLASGFLHDSVNQLRAEAFLLPILAMACWGFLHWNRPPARVFMGDAGSLSVGCLLALFAMAGERSQLGLRLPPISSLTVLCPFLFDAVLTLARRARMAQNLLKAHREHLYQRLLRTGLSHGQVLRMNLWRFLSCGCAGLAGSLTDFWAARWLGLALAVGVMAQYWFLTLKLEKLAASGRD